MGTAALRERRSVPPWAAAAILGVVRNAAIAWCAVVAGIGCGGTTNVLSARGGDGEGGDAAVDASAAGGGRGGSDHPGVDGGNALHPGSGGASTEGAGGAATAGVDAGANEPWRPPLAPAFADVWSDEPAYPDSGVPFCPGEANGERVIVFSDSRGVFAMTDLPFRIQTNDGTGWKPFYDGGGQVGFARLTGFPSGPLVVGSDATCGVQFVTDNARSCSAASSVDGVFVVNEHLAYAVSRDRVLRYDGTSWTEFTEPLEPNGAEPWTTSVWANEEMVVVGTRAQDLYVYRNGDPRFTPYFDVASGHWWSVWGLSSSTVYAGSWDGQIMRFDGSAWTKVGDIGSACGGIRGLWGTSDKVFFHSRRQLGVVAGNTVKTLAGWPCDSDVEIESLWGNSATQLFLGVFDWGRVDATCQDGHVLGYDGVHLKRL